MPNAHDTKGSTRFFHLLAFVLIAALVGIAGYGYFLYHRRVVTEEKRKELSAIADLKAGQIKQWRKDCLTDAAVIFSNAMITHRLAECLAGRDTTEINREFQSWMTVLKNRAEFSKVLLVRPDGHVICSIPGDTTPLTGHLTNMLAEAQRRREPLFSDLHRDSPSGSIHLNMIVPLMSGPASHSRCLGLLVLEIDPHTFLYPLLGSWPSPSRSAETILVERDGEDVLFLNDLRFRKDTALTLRRPLSQKSMPAVHAILEPDGLFTGIDYRGTPVLSASRRIPGSTWVIFTKVDTAEIFAPVYRRAWFVASTCLMTVFSAGLGVYLWWMRKQDENLRMRYETERRYNADLREAEAALQEAHRQLEQRVAERTAELTETNVRLRQEITERELLEQQLLKAKKLESVGQLAGGVAHEVRNPLNAILSITEALFKEKGIEDRPEFTPYIQHIRAQVRRLANLMNDLLDLGKPIPTSSLHPVPLDDLCRETIHLWKSFDSSGAATREIILSGERSGNLAVMADHSKLQQALINLLDNAAQHCPEGSEILLQLEMADTPDPSEQMGIVRIIDAGQGVPPDKIARVFDPFFTNRKGGTGLGLALVKHYIESMGGSVRLRNNDPPPGCTAEVRIPLTAREQA